MVISKFLSDANFGLVSFTILIYPMINYNNKIDSFTNNDKTGQIVVRLSYNIFSGFIIINVVLCRSGLDEICFTELIVICHF